MYSNNRFTADNIKPARYTRVTPYWQDVIAIGRTTNGKYFTNVSVRVLKPTVQYPSCPIRISMSNGNGYSYAEVTISELKDLIRKIDEWTQHLESVLPELEQLQKLAEETNRRYQEQQDLVRSLVEIQKDNELPPQEEYEANVR